MATAEHSRALVHQEREGTMGNNMDDDVPDSPVKNGFDLCWGHDVVASFDTHRAAVLYGEAEFDSYFVVFKATGAVCASKCLHEND